MKEYSSSSDKESSRARDAAREQRNEDIRLLQEQHDACLQQSGVAEKAHQGILAQPFREIDPRLPLEACRFGVRVEENDGGDMARVVVTMTWDGGRDSWWEGQLTPYENVGLRPLAADALTEEEIATVELLANDVRQVMAPQQNGTYYLETS